MPTDDYILGCVFISLAVFSICCFVISHFKDRISDKIRSILFKKCIVCGRRKGKIRTTYVFPSELPDCKSLKDFDKELSHPLFYHNECIRQVCSIPQDFSISTIKLVGLVMDRVSAIKASKKAIQKAIDNEKLKAIERASGGEGLL